MNVHLRSSAFICGSFLFLAPEPALRWSVDEVVTSRLRAECPGHVARAFCLTPEKLRSSSGGSPESIETQSRKLFTSCAYLRNLWFNI
jgi:hypothetical protein